MVCKTIDNAMYECMYLCRMHECINCMYEIMHYTFLLKEVRCNRAYLSTSMIETRLEKIIVFDK